MTQVDTQATGTWEVARCLVPLSCCQHLSLSLCTTLMPLPTPCLPFLFCLSTHVTSELGHGVQEQIGNLCGFGKADEPIWSSNSPPVRWASPPAMLPALLDREIT